MNDVLLSRIFKELSEHHNLKSKMGEKEIYVMSKNNIVYVINNVGCIKATCSRNDGLFYLIFDTVSKIRAEIQSECFENRK